jgi:hypothetical protein
LKLNIEWSRPITLRSGAKEGLIYTVNLDKLPRTPGIYIFARKWGRSFEALYVGKSGNLQSRVKTHLNNLRLMRHLETSKTGKRFVIVGQIRTLPGQQRVKVLSILERAYIRYFLSEGHDLVNKQGVRIRRHELLSQGAVPRAFIPSHMFIEKSRGQ